MARASSKGELVAFDQGAYPALAGGGDSEELMAAIRENLGGQGITEFDLERIKIPAGGGQAFELPGEDGEIEVAQQVSGIVVYFRDVRAYWATEFAGGADPPQCTSPNSIDGHGDPGDQLGIEGACSRCPYAQFGSDPRESSNAQACKQMRQLFLLRPGAMLPTLVVLPPTSIKPARRYFLGLATRSTIYRHTLTTLGLEKATNATGILYSLATFRQGERLPPEMRALVDSYAADLRPAFERTPIDTGARDGYAGTEEDVPQGETISDYS